MSQDHYTLCPAEIITCQYCQTSRSRSEHSTHINQCPQITVNCTHSEFGCPWADQRQHLEDHIVYCPYESIKHYLYKQEQTEKSLRTEIQQLHKENESLKRQQTESKQQTETITQQLDLMFPGHFIHDADIPEEARNESVLSENQRVNNELETLSANIASLELKQNMALMTETFRLQEELQSLRAICHGLRMQMHFVMMERKMTTTNPSNAPNTNAGSSNNNTNNGSNRGTTAGNDTSVNGSLNRMRTWLGKCGGFFFFIVF